MSFVQDNTIITPYLSLLCCTYLQDAVRWQSLYSSPGLTEQIVSHSLHNSSHEWMVNSFTLVRSKVWLKLIRLNQKNLACPKAQRGLISEPLANGNNQESALM